MSRKSGVGGYRGRKTGNDILKAVVAALTVLALGLVGVTLLGSDSLIEKLAVFSTEKTEQQGSVQPDAPQQEDAAPETKPQPEPEPEPVVEPEPEPEVMKALEMSVEEALSIAAPQRMKAEGANSLILNMKPEDGPLEWRSAHPMAAEVQANSETEGINELLKTLNGQGYHTIARISCFRDEMLCVNKEYCIRSNSGYRWEDFEKVNWASPYSQQVQDYLLALMVELAELGFEEILLDHCGYPPDGSGQMGWIKRGPSYDPEQMDAVIGEFLRKAREALQPYEVTLSIRTKAEILMQEGMKTGVTASVVDQWAQRIWMAQGEGELTATQVLEQLQIKEVFQRLVVEVPAFEEGTQMPQAIFLEK